MGKSNGPVIGVIEWSSDSGVEPAVFLGDTAADVRRAAVVHLWPMAKRDEIDYIDAAWVGEHPHPDLDDDAAVTEWLEQLREATTDAWLMLYTRSDEPGSDEYADLRR